MNESPQVKRWSDVFGGPLSESSIRGIVSPNERFRISRRNYPANAHFQGSGHSGTCYVLAGRCRIDFQLPYDIPLIELGAGEFAEFPTGRYEFKVIGEHDADLVMVWEIPIT
jgi:hypothetical protein